MKRGFLCHAKLTVSPGAIVIEQKRSREAFCNSPTDNYSYSSVNFGRKLVSVSARLFSFSQQRRCSTTKARRYEEAFTLLQRSLENQTSPLESSSSKHPLFTASVQVSPLVTSDDHEAVLAWPLIVFENGSGTNGCSYAAALYNAGLACHCQASSCTDDRINNNGGSSRPPRFWQQQAQDYYQRAYREAYCLDTPILHLSLCHNLVALAHQMADEESLDYWCHNLTQYVVRCDAPAPLFRRSCYSTKEAAAPAA
eukprot:scaffold5813_cov189-Amphora_coffeaeformis.AAC.4